MKYVQDLISCIYEMLNITIITTFSDFVDNYNMSKTVYGFAIIMQYGVDGISTQVYKNILIIIHNILHYYSKSIYCLEHVVDVNNDSSLLDCYDIELFI